MEELKPKVFISYTWTSDEYIRRVVDLANQLISNGVDVLLDQFEMKPGHSLNNYMEKCVGDPSVTHVILLLNPDYKEKANSRKGGTGIETQIISSEVYGNLESDKFIPVLFDRDGLTPSDCVPIYLKDRYRLDLSNEDSYGENYIQLLRTLYHKPQFTKPQLGKMPDWLLSGNVSSRESLIETEIKNGKRFNRVQDSIDISFEALYAETNEYCDNEIVDSITSENFCEEYSKIYKLRNLILTVISNLAKEDIEESIFDFFQFVENKIRRLELDALNSSKVIIMHILMHEVFVEMVSILYKQKKYSLIHSLVSRTYLTGPNREPSDCVSMFYSIIKCQISNLDDALGHKLHESPDKYYFTGIGENWIRNLPSNYVSKDEFSNADVLITNIVATYSMRYWFAISYTYGSRTGSWILDIANGLKSKKLCQRYGPLFGASSIDEMKEKVDHIRKFDEGRNYRLGYSESFDTIDLISKHIKTEEIGSLN